MQCCTAAVGCCKLCNGGTSRFSCLPCCPCMPEPALAVCEHGVNASGVVQHKAAGVADTASSMQSLRELQPSWGQYLMLWSTLPLTVEMWFCQRCRDDFRHCLYNSCCLPNETAFSALQVLTTCHVTSAGPVKSQSVHNDQSRMSQA